MKLIVGLGNPGDRYLKTRHNIGFIVLDQFVTSNQIDDFSYDNKYGGEVTVGVVNGEKILYLKPMEYMNKSGDAVQRLMSFYKIEAYDLLVLHDDIDLTVGTIKSKLGGGLAGHNGLKSIAEKLGTKEFSRIRIGVDRPTNSDNVADYVLGNFKKEEVEIIHDKYLNIEGLIDEFLN